MKPSEKFAYNEKIAKHGFKASPFFLHTRGKGIGRNVLRNIVKQQSEAGYSVYLDVETKNVHALGLYESIGFKVIHAQDYYLYQK